MLFDIQNRVTLWSVFFKRDKMKPCALSTERLTPEDT